MEKLTGFAAELIELSILLVGAGVASFAGIALERFGLAAVIGGDLVIGAWAVGMGLLALYVGVVALGYEQVVPRLRALGDAE